MVLKENYIKFEFPSKNENISLARSIVAAFVSQLDITIGELDEIKTIVSEIVTNSIIHGYKNSEGIIKVFAYYIENTLKLTIKDNGIGIEDIEKSKEPFYTTENDKRSGMGFTIISEFSDSLNIISSPKNGCSIEVIKKLKIKFDD